MHVFFILIASMLANDIVDCDCSFMIMMLIMVVTVIIVIMEKTFSQCTEQGWQRHSTAVSLGWPHTSCKEDHLTPGILNCMIHISRRKRECIAVDKIMVILRSQQTGGDLAYCLRLIDNTISQFLFSRPHLAIVTILTKHFTFILPHEMLRRQAPCSVFRWLVIMGLWK